MKKTAVSSLLALACLSPIMAQEAKQSWDFNPFEFYPLNQPYSFYIGLGAGATFFGDGAVDVKNNKSGADDLDFDTGYSLALRAGQSFGPLRFEGEFNYLDASVNSIQSSTGPISVNSDFSSFGLMGNVLWDFDFKPFTLTVGGGLGFTHLSYDQMVDKGNVLVPDSSKTVFAGQFIIGLGYQITENAKLGLNYRYMMMSGFNDRGDVVTGSPSSSVISFDDVSSSTLELGLTWKF